MTRQRGRIVLKLLAVAVGVCILVWCVATVGLYAAMRQPPERFGAIMARVPTIAMRLLPFRRLWMSARAGNLQIGDQAPDFELPTLHGNGRVKLSDASRPRPVVLIFGSYT